MYVYVYNIYIYIYIYIYKFNKSRERQRADSQLAMYNDIHMILPYPNFIHFEKLLLHNRSKECAFSPTFKCIQQLCLFLGRKQSKTVLVQGIYILHSLFKKYVASQMQTNSIPAVDQQQTNSIPFSLCFIHSSSFH